MSLYPSIVPGIYIGTAGWNVPAALKSFFPVNGSHLERYAQVLTAVEINSSFYRNHKPQVYARWAASVPDHFRFSVKLSRTFTHEKRLQETGKALHETIYGISALGEKWGVLLVQLPPSLEFDKLTAKKFLHELRGIYSGPLAWEPRHRSWTSEQALHLLASYDVHKVKADPEPCPMPPARSPNETACVYYRLHGTPEIYRSRYSEDQLQNRAHDINMILREGKDVWCIFDNTTFGYATENALELRNFIGPSSLHQSAEVQIFTNPP